MRRWIRLPLRRQEPAHVPLDSNIDIVGNTPAHQAQHSWENKIRGIIVVSPGGLGGHGGMASITAVISNWLKTSAPTMPIFVVDSRGRGHVWRSPFYFSYAIFQVILLGRARSVEVLHLQVSERGSFIRKGLLLILGKAFGMRVVLHHHGAELIPFYQNASSLMRRWTSWVVRHADTNIVLGQCWRDFLTDDISVPDERVVILHNAVADVNELSRSQPEPSLIQETRRSFHVVVLAHLSPRKGIGELLQALQQLHHQGVVVRATLAGGGDLRRYNAEAAMLGISMLCTFTGWIERREASALLLSADALVLPSFNEGLPMAILEALSAGVPVVSTPVGSIGEVLTDGVNYLRIAPGDKDALSAAIGSLAANPELGRSLAYNGRVLFEQKFTIEAFMSGLLAVYDRVQTSAVVPLVVRV